VQESIDESLGEAENAAESIKNAEENKRR